MLVCVVVNVLRVGRRLVFEVGWLVDATVDGIARRLERGSGVSLCIDVLAADSWDVARIACKKAWRAQGLASLA